MSDILMSLLVVVLVIVELCLLGLNIFGSITTFGFVVIVVALVVWSRS
jgi:hypothetical protein